MGQREGAGVPIWRNNLSKILSLATIGVWKTLKRKKKTICHERLDKSKDENKRLFLSSKPGEQCQGKSGGESHERKACIWLWICWILSHSGDNQKKMKVVLMPKQHEKWRQDRIAATISATGKSTITNVFNYFDHSLSSFNTDTQSNGYSEWSFQ